MEFRDKPMENLIRLQEKDICKNVQALLLEGETDLGLLVKNTLDAVDWDALGTHLPGVFRHG